MSAIVKMTLYGMYKYMDDHNDDLFYNLTVPTGMDKTKLEDVILLKGAEFCMLWGDPYFVKDMIAVWSNKYSHTLTRWVNALSIDYNPLENYDRMEDWVDSGSRSKTDNRSSSILDKKTHAETGSSSEDLTRTEGTTSAATSSESTTNANDTDSKTDASKASNSITENTVSAYDANTYQPDNKSAVDNTEGNNAHTVTGSTGSSTMDGTTSESSKTDGSEGRQSSDSRSSSDSAEHTEDQSGSEDELSSGRKTGRAHGNIGVTTSQQMLQSEWDIARLNIYEEAADLFLSEFCVYVY